MILAFYTKVHQLLDTIIYNARRNIINRVLISLPNLIHMRTMIYHAFLQHHQQYLFSILRHAEQST